MKPENISGWFRHEGDAFRHQIIKRSGQIAMISLVVLAPTQERGAPTRAERRAAVTEASDALTATYGPPSRGKDMDGKPISTWRTLDPLDFTVTDLPNGVLLDLRNRANLTTFIGPE